MEQNEIALLSGHGKECWLEPLHSFIRVSVPQVKQFIDKAVDIEEANGTSSGSGGRG